MKQYLDLARDILENGHVREDRTGTGTISKFGTSLRFDLTKGFPAVTTKKLAWRSVVSELLWILEGSSDDFRLKEILHGSRASEKSTIWTANIQSSQWTNKRLNRHPGDGGRIYGVQLRNWRAPLVRINKVVLQNHDQLLALVKGIKEDPYSRRHIISFWNPGELELGALPPCHMLSQFYVQPFNQAEIEQVYATYKASLSPEERAYLTLQHAGEEKTAETLMSVGLPTGKLSCSMTQRSADFFLGSSFNIASYALLTHMLAQVCGLGVGELVINIGDTHIYLDHVNAVKEQLSRDPLPLPTLWLNPNVNTITGFTMDDIKLVNYQSLDPIPAPMSV